MIGVTLGFLLTGIPFGFMALLGFLSLSGMLVKNGIVLVDEIACRSTPAKRPTAPWWTRPLVAYARSPWPR
ncbi:hypothetical protein ULF88_10930 [Halopseudomonas pachastrellae]|nr:hypothetical protein [Halopseudomonas pachastrellae]